MPHVGVVKSLGNLGDNSHRLDFRKPTLGLDPIAEIDPFDEFVDKVADRAVGHDLQRADDVRVFELRGGPEFLGEPLVKHGVFGQPGLEYLDGDRAAGLAVACAVHASGTAATDRFTEFVARRGGGAIDGRG